MARGRNTPGSSGENYQNKNAILPPHLHIPSDQATRCSLTLRVRIHCCWGEENKSVLLKYERSIFIYGHVRVFKSIQVDKFYINIWA